MWDWVVDARHIRIEVIRKPIKHAYIRVKEKNCLLVTAGNQVSDQAIRDLIQKHRRKLIRMLNSVETKPLTDANQIAVFGVSFHIEEVEAERSSLTIESQRIILYGKRKDLRLKALERFYQKVVIDAATEMLADLDQSLGRDIRLTAITLKSQRMKSQLGSCIPAKRIIKLNSLLGRLDKRYCRAILIHELIHLQIAGHQADFYRLMERYLPEYRVLRRELLAILKRI